MTTRTRGRIVVCDGCIDRAGAHPWAYAAALHAASHRCGRRCSIVSHRSFLPPDDFQHPADLFPLFRRHGATRLTAFAEVERLASRRRGRQLPCEAWLRASARRRRVADFAADIAPVIADLVPGDHLLVATASELDALGLARAIRAADAPVGIGWHLQFHAPLLDAAAGPEDEPSPGVLRAGRLLARAIATAAPHSLRFHATTAELAAEWAWAGAAGIGVLPYPVSPPSGSATPQEGDAPLRIALLGDARAEKNSHLVARLAEALDEDRSLGARVRLAVQTNRGFPADSRRPGDVAVTEALAAIRGRSDDRVEDLGGPLDAAAFRAEVRRADGLLLPYDERRYRHRLSALMLEALAAGKVAIVTPGGWMARCIMPAIRGHGESLAADHPPLLVARAEAVTVRPGNPLVLALDPPPGADVAVVEARWSRRSRVPEGRARSPGDLPFDTPLSVSFGPGTFPDGAMLAQPLDGGAAVALFRLRDPPARAVVEARESGEGVDVSLAIRWLRCGREPPLGAAGIILPRAGAAEMALREFADNRDHYLATARRGAAAVAAAHAPEAILRTLDP